LVLDEYHVIPNRYLHDVVEQFLIYMPENVTLVLIGREDPPLKLSKLRLSGRLHEIRAETLAFSPEEIETVLMKLTGRRVNPKSLSVLCEKTEGWPAAVTLCAATLTGLSPEEIDEQVNSFDGEHRYIIDFFLEEILRDIDENTIDFLGKTAYLDYLIPDLCDHLTGKAGSAERLRSLKEKNLPLIRIPGDVPMYRYHHLFADYIQSVFGSQIEKGPVFERAGEWCVEKGYFNEALHFLTLSGNTGRLQSLIELHFRESFKRGHFVLIEKRIQLLPPGYVRTSPICLFYRGWLELLSGRISGAEASINRIASAGQENPLPEEMSRCLIAWIAVAKKIDPSPAGAGEYKTESETLFRSLAQIAEGRRALEKGDFAAAERLLRVVLSKAETAGLALNIALALHTLSFVLIDTGRKNEALELCESYLEDPAVMVAGEIGKAEERKGDTALPADPLSALVLIPCAVSLCESGQLKKAADTARAACGVLPPLSFGPLPIREGAAVLYDIETAAGDEPGALSLIRSALQAGENAAEQYGGEFLAVDAWEGRGDPTDLRRRQWFESVERRLTSDDPFRTLLFRECIVYVSFLLTRNRINEAVALMRRMFATGVEKLGLREKIELYLVYGKACGLSGDNGAALESVEKAVALARPGMYTASLLKYGAFLREMFSRLSPKVRDFIQGLPETPVSRQSAPPGPSAGARGDLSRREREILGVLAQGLSNTEIAERLFISEGTVKWHLNNIFEKLDVKNRTGAVNIAREMGIIERHE
jgi:LuxR family maltose regulon positive regulatory protein